MSALSPADREQLSAYLDNELTPEERTVLERRLAEEPYLRAELESLRRVVALVREVPVIPAPRNFLLDPAVYGRRATPRPRLQRTYRWASALSAVAAVVVFTLGFMGILANQSGLFLTGQDAELQQASNVQAPTAEAIAIVPTGTPAATLPGTAATGVSDRVFEAEGVVVAETPVEDAEAPAAANGAGAAAVAEEEAAPDADVVEEEMAFEAAEADDAVEAPAVSEQQMLTATAEVIPPMQQAEAADEAFVEPDRREPPGTGLGGVPPGAGGMGGGKEPPAPLMPTTIISVTATPQPSPLPEQALEATVTAVEETAPSSPVLGIAPGIFVGAGVLLLGLSGAFWFLSRRT